MWRFVKAGVFKRKICVVYYPASQTALKDVTRFLDRFTQRELAALDLRVDALLPPDASREIDNPFAVAYILDAVGSSARAVYPNPRVWRPFRFSMQIPSLSARGISTTPKTSSVTCTMSVS